MDTKQLRKILFLCGCIPCRLFIAYFAYWCSADNLPMCGYIALCIATGFLYFYFSGTRKTGAETFGAPIWWNNLRPIHATMYLLFAYFAINKKHFAYIFLLIDALCGIIYEQLHVLQY